MYYLLAAFCSSLIALMIVTNGSLGAACDVYLATVIIHATGLLLISLILFLRKENPFRTGGCSPALFLGGALGVGTTVFNNLGYGKISVTAILALSLFGQALTSLIIDHFGFFDMPVRRFNRAKLLGFLCTFAGIVFLFYGSTFAWFPVIVSLLSGITIVTSRSVNAELAEHTSPLISTWYNYVVGLVCCTALWLFAIPAGGSSFHFPVSSDLFIYTGGLIGVCSILILNLTVQKMPAFIMTLIMFIGQIFTGMLLDLIAGEPFSLPKLLGGILAAAGLVANLWLDRRSAA